MKSLNQIREYPTGRALYADSIIEYHASRLILLLKYCGTKERSNGTFRIDGLTKLAKLDFFIRYPQFFKTVSKKLEKDVEVERKDIDSKMIRFHYGPWDHRYYQVLPYLEARGLIEIESISNTYKIRLTQKGVSVSESFDEVTSFENLIKDMRTVKKVLGQFSGTKLKDLVYDTFGDEVAIKKLKDEIGYE